MQGITKLFILLVLTAGLVSQASAQKKLVYLVSDMNIPFWQIMAKGVREKADDLGYEITVYGADNSLKKELQNTVQAIKEGAEGIILSPINSSSAVTVLRLAQKEGVPVVISDIGTDGGEYVSFISSDNKQGSYDIGRVLVQKMQESRKDEGSVGIIAIPQKRANGKARTQGFMQALDEAGIKAAGLKQQEDFSYQETYDYTKELIKNNPDMSALWLQGSHRYKAALDAMKDIGKSNEVLLVCFDAEPEFLELIPEGTLVGSAMQQPFLMGEKAVSVMDDHLHGKEVKKQIKMNILAISEKNIEQKLPVIKRNVLGLE
ncbi:MAG: substrate-binding domain-containing protein [Campylobacterota bacterium]